MGVGAEAGAEAGAEREREWEWERERERERPACVRITRVTTRQRSVLRTDEDSSSAASSAVAEGPRDALCAAIAELVAFVR